MARPAAQRCRTRRCATSPTPSSAPPSSARSSRAPATSSCARRPRAAWRRVKRAKSTASGRSRCLADHPVAYAPATRHERVQDAVELGQLDQDSVVLGERREQDTHIKCSCRLARAAGVEQALAHGLLEARRTRLKTVGGGTLGLGLGQTLVLGAQRGEVGHRRRIVVCGRERLCQRCRTPALRPPQEGPGVTGAQGRASSELGQLCPVPRRQGPQLLAAQGRAVLIEGREAAVARAEGGTGVAGGLGEPRRRQPAEGPLGRRATLRRGGCLFQPLVGKGGSPRRPHRSAQPGAEHEDLRQLAGTGAARHDHEPFDATQQRRARTLLAVPSGECEEVSAHAVGVATLGAQQPGGLLGGRDRAAGVACGEGRAGQ